MFAALLLLLAPLETPDPRPKVPTAKWLIGTWLIDADRTDLARDACNSGSTMAYRADGKTIFFEGKGRWRLRGDRLSERTTKLFDTADPADFPNIGHWEHYRIERVGPHEGVMIDGSTRIPMLRCRPGDIR